MAKDRKLGVNPVMSKIALLGGAAVISGAVALAGAGAAAAHTSTSTTPSPNPITQLGHAGTFYNHQLGNLGTFLNTQAGNAGNFYSVQTGHAISGLLDSLLGKNTGTG